MYSRDIRSQVIPTASTCRTSQRIQIHASHGQMTLNGALPSAGDVAPFVSMVEHVTGVRSVVNPIRVDL
jgi:osmotically-inducible protein OsmY